MLVTAFDFKLNHTIPQSVCAIGKFNGEHPALACGTTGGKVLVHTPHVTREANQMAGAQFKPKDIKYLNINKEIVSIEAGGMHP